MNISPAVDAPPAAISPADRRALFWACFTAIAATAAVFAVRGQVIGDWASEFGLTETQKGEILGVGLWPFAAAIVGVSMVADRIGYGKCLFFAFVCHVVSTIMLIFAQGYWWLYAGTFLVSIGNGAAQAIADPVVASMYRHNKTTWLNILHASWPAGMVAGGIAGIACFIGLSLLIHRRLFDPRIRKTSSFGDIAVLLMLYAQLILGLATILVSAQHLDGHEMVKFMNWAQGIVTLQAGASDYVADVALVFKLHLLLGMTILLVFPFTRLVHVWSVPVWYLGRTGYQLVRTNRPRGAVRRPSAVPAE